MVTLSIRADASRAVSSGCRERGRLQPLIRYAAASFEAGPERVPAASHAPPYRTCHVESEPEKLQRSRIAAGFKPAAILRYARTSFRLIPRIWLEFDPPLAVLGFVTSHHRLVARPALPALLRTCRSTVHLSCRSPMGGRSRYLLTVTFCSPARPPSPLTVLVPAVNVSDRPQFRQCGGSSLKLRR